MTLDKTLAFWQETLSLRDWEVMIDWGISAELPASAAAAISISTENRFAKIWILEGQTEVDHLTIHELLHIWLDAWKVQDGTLENEAKEAAINMIAKGMVELHGRLNSKSDTKYISKQAKAKPARRGSAKSGSRRSGKAGSSSTKSRNG
jgi:hypothetical protein